MPHTANDGTLLDRLLSQIKNNRVAAVALTIGIAVIAFAKFTGAIQEIRNALRADGGRKPAAEAPANPSQPQSAACTITGTVFNRDNSQGLPGTEILLAEPGSPTLLATSGPDGAFSASCADIPDSAFPISLQIRNSQWACKPGDQAPARSVAQQIHRGGASGVMIPVPVRDIVQTNKVACKF